jgi:hypothetical protein
LPDGWYDLGFFVSGRSFIGSRGSKGRMGAIRCATQRGSILFEGLLIAVFPHIRFRVREHIGIIAISDEDWTKMKEEGVNWMKINLVTVFAA